MFSHKLYRVRFSPDGTRLVTACHDLHARLWDIASGHVRAEFRHGAPVSSAEFSPDGSAVLTASFDKSARVWLLTNTATAFRVFRHRDQLSEARFSPDGRQVVAACFNGTAIVWDIATAARLAEPLTHRRTVHGAEFDRSGTRILTRSWDGTFRLWDARTGLPMGEPFDAGAKPLVIATTPDWDHLRRLHRRPGGARLGRTAAALACAGLVAGTCGSHRRQTLKHHQQCRTGCPCPCTPRLASPPLRLVPHQCVEPLGALVRCRPRPASTHLAPVAAFNLQRRTVLDSRTNKSRNLWRNKD